MSNFIYYFVGYLVGKNSDKILGFELKIWRKLKGMFKNEKGS